MICSSSRFTVSWYPSLIGLMRLSSNTKNQVVLIEISGRSFLPTKASQKKRAEPPTSANWFPGENVARGTSGEVSVEWEKMGNYFPRTLSLQNYANKLRRWEHKIIENPSEKSESINEGKFVFCHLPRTFRIIWCSILWVSFLNTQVYLPSSTFVAFLVKIVWLAACGYTISDDDSPDDHG